MEGPPSFTSAIARNLDRQNSQVTDPYQFEEHHYTPSMSEIRSLDDQSWPDLSFEAGTVPRAIVQPTGTNYDGGQAVSIGSMALGGREVQHHPFPNQLTDASVYSAQPPSIGSMARDGGNSLTGGGNFNYDAPPSYTDVAGRDPSYTGESGGGLNLLPDGNYEGVSLNKHDFAAHFSKMFQNDDDEYNPYRNNKSQ